MAAAAALERFTAPEYTPLEPTVFEVPELASDEFSRRRAARLIGHVAIEASADTSSESAVNATTSLVDALHRAEAGDPVARNMIEINVRTDVVERSIKAGHIMEVGLEVNERGQIVQYGQTAESIQANSLKYASGRKQIRSRTEAETCNMFRIEDANRQGLLSDYVFVVLSRAADDMSHEEMEDEGFFIDTMSVAIQATTTGPNGLTTESAFVAGKRSRTEERHDAETVRRLGSKLGVNLSGKSASETIDTPLLIHKSLMPNGVVDLVRLYDEAADGTFFGEAKPPQDYLAYRTQCRTREAELEPTVQEITNRLIADSATLQTPLAATRYLNKLSQASMVSRAKTDERIDPMVFGLEAAVHIQEARYWQMLGDTAQANIALDKAQATARSSSCPGSGTGKELEDMEGSGDGDGQKLKDKSGDDCEFTSKECPLCGAKNVKTVVKKISSTEKLIAGKCGCKKTVKA